MTSDAAQKLLEPGERLIWSHMPAEQKPPSENIVFGFRALAAANFLISLCVLTFGFMSNPETYLPVIRDGFIFAALGALFLWIGPRVRSWLPAALRQSGYSYCVITNRRVLLFNQLASGVKALPRHNLSRVKRDYFNGGIALVFQTDGDDATHAFVSIAHVDAASKVLEHG